MPAVHEGGDDLDYQLIVHVPREWKQPLVGSCCCPLSWTVLGEYEELPEFVGIGQRKRLL